MRNVYLIIVLIASGMIFQSCQNTSSKSFSIAGNIEGMDTGMIYLLKNEKHGAFTGLDTAKIEKGCFILEGALDYPQLLVLKLRHLDTEIPVFVENTKITFQSHIDSLENANIQGSASHNDYVSFNRSIQSLSNYQKEISILLYEAENAGDTIQLAEYSRVYDSVDMIKNAKIKDFISQNSKSMVSVYALRRYLVYYLEYQELKDLFEKLDTNLSQSDYYQYLSIRLETLNRCNIGKQAQDFTMNDTQDKPVSLSSFKGKVVLIDFWASWCEPCRQESPNLVKNYKRFHNKGFEILSISFDSKQSNWLKAIEDDKLEWTHVSELKGWESEVGKMYGVISIPHSLLIDRNGIIIAKGEDLRGENLLKKLEKVFN